VGLGSEAAAVRFHAALLGEALSDDATHVTETFLDGTEDHLDLILAAHADDHVHRIERAMREEELTDEVHAER
jgi:hypothetical protein